MESAKSASSARSGTGTMRVAVVQMRCDDTGNKRANMETFRTLVEEAFRQGSANDGSGRSQFPPELILGPEFAICGYTYDYETMWNAAECQGGPTELFLCQLAAQHSVYIGVSYLEARFIDTEPHFLNTFALAGPNGTICGRASKTTPCSVESYFFRAPPPDSGASSESKREQRPHVIECDGHRFGVLICYENFIYESLLELQQAAPLDLLLQPFSGPLADDAKKVVKDALCRMYHDCCATTARYLGCPALYCNKVGPWKQPSPSTILPMTFDTEFPGGSAICSADGTELGRMSTEESGVLCRDVVLGTAGSEASSSLVQAVIPRFMCGYTDPSPFLKVCVMFEWLGARSYNSDKLRKTLAKKTLDEANTKCGIAGQRCPS